MSEQEKISSGVGVVIPVYNRPVTLVDTLKYVLGQTRVPAKLVIVDDGSTDHTADVVEAWLEEQDPTFEWLVIRQPKSTAARARASGFEHVKDLPYVTFLDSDDHWPTDYLERMTACLDANPSLVAAFADRKYELVLAEQAQSVGGPEMVKDPIVWMFFHGGGITSSTVLRSSAYLESGGWPVEMHFSEDMYLFTRIAFLGEWGHVEGVPVTYHLGSAKARNEEGNLSRRLDNSAFVWVKNLEMIYAMVCEEGAVVDRSSMRRALSQRWCGAGRSFRSVKDYHSARYCFARSIRWSPLNGESWRRWGKMTRKSLFAAKRPVNE